jgi:hypothetical protein
MYRAFLAWLALIPLMTACVPSAAPSLRVEPSESADACSAITTATSVQVLLPPGTAPVGKGAYRLIDPETVRRLVDFVNLRKNVSPPSADTPPTPRLRATFYDGTRNVGIFGSGAGVFYLQCGTVRGTRYASVAETTEFEMLSARPNAAQ